MSKTPPIEVKITLDPAELPEQMRRDLEANAQLQRKSPAELVADLIAKRLAQSPFRVATVHSALA